MSDIQLSRLIDAYEQLATDLHSRRLEVWDELARVAPEVASEILDLFANRDAAAIWVTKSRDGVQASPAKLVVEGNMTEVVARIRRAAHGFAA